MQIAALMALACALLAACGGGPGQDVPQVVVMTGDSITYNWQLWGNLPSTYIDKGVAGDTTAMMEKRFAADVLSLHPTVVVILGGTNDISIGDSDGYEVYPTHIFAMVQAAQAAGALVIVGTVMRGLEDTSNAIPAWNAAIVAGAAAYGYVVADYYSKFLNADGSQNLSLYNSDGIHPNAEGYAVMNEVLASALAAATGSSGPPSS